MKTAKWFIALVVAVSSGCHTRQTSFHDDLDVPWRVHSDSPTAVSANIDHINVSLPEIQPPRTPSSPESTAVHELSLQDAIKTALANAEVVRSMTGGAVTLVPSRTSAYDPAIAETDIEAALAVFDASLDANVFWNQQDQPPQASAGFTRPGSLDIANVNSTLSKPLATGGVASIAYITDYLFIDPIPLFDSATGLPIINPNTGRQRQFRSPAQYTPHVDFTLSQNLFRGAGSDINRAPIVIARLGSDQSMWTFKEGLLALVRSVETAYWGLYASHQALRALEQVIPETARLLQIQDQRVKSGAEIEATLGQVQGDFANFRQQRIQALNAVLTSESRLRNLLGLPPNSDSRIVPLDIPLTAPIAIDWNGTLATALSQRPDIIRQKLAVRIQELNLLIARNQLLPQLSVQGTWRISGLDNELDEAIDLLSDNKFTDWSIGINYQTYFGKRQAAAAAQQSELQLQKEHANLRQQAHAAAFELSDIVRDLNSIYLQYRMSQERVAAYQKWVEGNRTIAADPPAGRSLADAQDIYLRSLQSWSTAAIDAARLIADYNTQLARLEEAKGTLLESSNIVLQEDPTAALTFKSSYIMLSPEYFCNELSTMNPISDSAEEQFPEAPMDQPLQVQPLEPNELPAAVDPVLSAPTAHQVRPQFDQSASSGDHVEIEQVGFESNDSSSDRELVPVRLAH